MPGPFDSIDYRRRNFYNKAYIGQYANQFRLKLHTDLKGNELTSRLNYLLPKVGLKCDHNGQYSIKQINLLLSNYFGKLDELRKIWNENVSFNPPIERKKIDKNEKPVQYVPRRKGESNASNELLRQQEIFSDDMFEITRKDIKYMVTETIRRILSDDKNTLSYVTSKISQIENFWEKLDFISKYYRLLGNGVSRWVFQIDDDLVLKIERKSLTLSEMQNYSEVMAYEQSNHNPILPKIYYYGNDYTWIISEYVLPCERYDFINLTGIKGFLTDEYTDVYPSRLKNDAEQHAKSRDKFTRERWQALLDRINTTEDNLETYYDYFGKDYIQTKSEDAFDEESKAFSVDDFIYWANTGEDGNELYKKLATENWWFKNLYKLTREIGLDDIHLGNFGIANRNGNPCIVILDAGISENV